MECDGERFPALIDRMLVGDLSRRSWRKIRVHLDACEMCRRHYDRVATIERALQGNAEPNDSALLHFAEEAAFSSAPIARKVPVALGALAFAACALLALPTLLKPSSESFQARGPAGEAPSFGLRTFCIAQDSRGGSDEIVGSAMSQDEGAVLRCPLGDRIQFAVTYRGTNQAELSLRGLDGNGTSHVYCDRHPLLPGAANEPLPWSHQLSNHQPGKVRIEATIDDDTKEVLVLEVVR